MDKCTGQKTIVTPQWSTTAFDHGITHFDLANNYGPGPGAAEENFGRILRKDLGVYRDELVISTKAGYNMWPEPYGDWGSKKHLTASLDQSLRRMGPDYVDIFYHHRPDPQTPLEETAGALNAVAKRRGQSLAQMALAWILRDGDIASVLIGASKPEQILDNIGMIKNTEFSEEKRKEIDRIKG